LAPGIYLLVAWHLFTPLLILDKGLDFWQALECSRRVVTRHWWTCGALFLLAVLAVAAGLLACLVGVLVTLPLATAAVVVAYEDVFGARPEARSGGMLPPPETPVDEPDLGAQVQAPGAEPGERGAAQLSPSDQRMPEPGQGSEPGAAIAPKEIRPSELGFVPVEEKTPADATKAESLGDAGAAEQGSAGGSELKPAVPMEDPGQSARPKRRARAASKSVKPKAGVVKGVAVRSRKKV
jgi:hypothetical protein